MFFIDVTSQDETFHLFALMPYRKIAAGQNFNHLEVDLESYEQRKVE